MARLATTIGRAAKFAERHRGVILSVVAAGLVFAIITPLPPGLMDVLLAANLALAALVLLAVIYAARPTELSVFPSLLLLATLLRLVLNVASTRLILTAGAGGAGPAAGRFAAGHVIWSFSEFVTSGSLVAGAIVLAILVVIQFIVITKGAARMSEVAARFTLDAMPGKQMAIDADLNAGRIAEAEAGGRRDDIVREADFYGAMDGASKFLRGDAMAAVVIIFVNILGGLYVGLVQYGWSWGQSVALFTRLTIGDGLVTQIPAFLLSVSAALLVARSTARANLGEEVLAQLGSRPVVPAITAVFLGALMFTSLPKIPLLMLGVGLGGLAVLLARRGRQAHDDAQAARPPAPEEIEKLLSVDPIRVELGYALVRLVEADGGDLMERIASLRREVATAKGLLVPPIRIRDNMRLGAHRYAILLRGAKVAEGTLHPDQMLAIAGEQVAGKLLGRETTDPVDGAHAMWINPTQRGRAETMNYIVLTPCEALMRHVAEVVGGRAADLLTRQQVGRLLDNLKPTAESLVREATEKFTPGQIQKVLQGLLRERVSIRDLEGILEALCDAAGRTEDPAKLTEMVRGSLGGSLSRQFCSADGRLWCVCLDPRLEDALTGHALDAPGAVAIAPEMGGRITRAVSDGLTGLRRQGKTPVVLCAPQVRPALKQLISGAEPHAAVLGYNEVESVEVQPIASVGIQS